jgi:hypothetical protein
MGAQTFRCGILEQEPIQQLLNERFVCIEYDATEKGALPAERYPGLAHIRRLWDIDPWTRQGFGGQWVIDPEGRYMLATGPSRPYKMGNQGALFQQSVELALARFARIRSCARDSAEESEEIRKLQGEIDREVREKHRGFDPMLRTRGMLDRKNPSGRRFDGVLKSPDPVVRRQIADLLGRFAEAEGREPFLPGGKWEFFSRSIAGYLDDEIPEVRAAAAGALLRFVGDEIPTLEGDELVSTARQRWGRAQPSGRTSSYGD